MRVSAAPLWSGGRRYIQLVYTVPRSDKAVDERKQNLQSHIARGLCKMSRLEGMGEKEMATFQIKAENQHDQNTVADQSSTFDTL